MAIRALTVVLHGLYSVTVVTVLDAVRARLDFTSESFFDLKEFGGGGLVSSVQCTMKTHKPQTEIKVRPIHASIRHPFALAMRWIAKLIRDYLRSFSHLVSGSGLSQLPMYGAL